MGLNLSPTKKMEKKFVLPNLTVLRFVVDKKPKYQRAKQRQQPICGSRLDRILKVAVECCALIVLYDASLLLAAYSTLLS